MPAGSCAGRSRFKPAIFSHHSAEYFPPITHSPITHRLIALFKVNRGEIKDDISLGLTELAGTDMEGLEFNDIGRRDKIGRARCWGTMSCA
jgi:hypothetical protein